MIHREFISGFCCAMLSLFASGIADATPRTDTGIDVFKLEKGGNFSFDGIDFRLLHFGQDWQRSTQSARTAEGGYEALAKDSWIWTGGLAVRGASDALSIREHFTSFGEQGIRVDYSVNYPNSAGLQTNEFALELVIPVTTAAGRSLLLDEDDSLLLPEAVGKLALAGNLRATKLLIPSATGAVLLESDKAMAIRIEDMRAWKYPTFDFRLRIRLPVSGGKLRQSNFSLTLKHLPEAGGNRIEPFVMKAGADWAPYEHIVDIEPGSVFDFSFLADAPAGKYGRLIVAENGSFEFANRPGEPVRLWGVNLCFSANFLNRNEADTLAARLAASGYNTVRFHHYDAGLGKKGERSDNYLDAQKMDQLDYLFAAMKREGLYINLDLYTLRSWNFTNKELEEMGLKSGENSVYAFKALVPISEAAMTNWENFARSLLARRNPYTGLTWAEDPALVGICPVNEDVLSWNRILRIPSVRAQYEAAFERWWAIEENRTRVSDKRDVGLNRFLFERHIEADRRMHDFLRTLGVSAPLTGTNFLNMQALAYVREHYDVVDNHQYWAHPKRIPGAHGKPDRMGFSQESSVGFLAESPRGIMQSRLWGKPYTVTEFNFLAPNQYRAEGGILLPAYASLQDWNALYNFEYASRSAYAMHGGTARNFSLTADPLGLLADRLSALIFLRRDVQVAKNAIGFAVDEPSAFAAEDVPVPEVFTKIGLVSRIGIGTASPAQQMRDFDLRAVVVNEGQTAYPMNDNVYAATPELVERLLQDSVLPAGAVDDTGKRFHSDTGEIELNAGDGTVKVVTDRSELFIARAKSELQGDVVSVNNGDTFATVSVVSVDGRALASSNRLLVLHLTDAVPSGTRFSLPDRMILESWGEAPHIIRAGSTAITLRLDVGANYQAWIVDSAGRRLREADFKKNGDAWLLSASTVTQDGTQLAYEIVRLRNSD